MFEIQMVSAYETEFQSPRWFIQLFPVSGNATAHTFGPTSFEGDFALALPQDGPDYWIPFSNYEDAREWFFFLIENDFLRESLGIDEWIYNELASGDANNMGTETAQLELLYSGYSDGYETYRIDLIDFNNA